ncbi:NAD(P)/FAD-dependent oxidoreductase [Mesorhizobium kowhaii]|uniref:NAD(P)/FAD-dependent oxidoreductase n=1 Tax=Mesorhizobium kowhaii TaxID=1300272 RepID=UPI0035E68E4F
MIYDVAVIGGGPAGSAFAARAAHAGLWIVLLDRPPSREHRIGESLPGSALHLLRNSGFVPSATHIALKGSISVWGGPTPLMEDHFGHPFGAGLRLDRALFDIELRAWAQNNGADLVHETIRLIRRDGSEQFLLETNGGRQVGSRYVVDASGRSAFAARRLGAEHQGHQTLFAVYGMLPVRDARCARTVVVATCEGWWYAVVVPGDRLLASFHCDPRHARWLLRNAGAWLEHLKAVPMIAEQFGICTGEPPTLAIADASSRSLDHCQGDGWLAIGDAVRAFDPLTSQGLYAAIQDGIDGAEAVTASFSGNHEQLGAFIKRRAARHASIERRRRQVYLAEDRWAETPFWTLRQNQVGRDNYLQGSRRDD